MGGIETVMCGDGTESNTAATIDGLALPLDIKTEPADEG